VRGIIFAALPAENHAVELFFRILRESMPEEWGMLVSQPSSPEAKIRLWTPKKAP
jgi:hypothetical protein